MFQMKQEILPDIPQENTPQTQSMYQQLRRTSQKWFTRSHKRIFDNHRSNHHSEINQNRMNYSDRVQYFELKPQKGMDSVEKSTIINMMREQIQINCQLYVSKMNKLLQEQAKKIKILGDLLLKNQIELNTRNDVIEKISLKIIKMQGKVSKECSSESKLQNMIEKRVFQLEEGIRQISKILKNKSNDKFVNVEDQIKDISDKLTARFYSSLQQIRQNLQERMDRVEKVMQMNNNSSLGTRSSISKGKSNRNDDIQRKNLLLTQQIEELRQEIQSFKRKKFKYENYKLQLLQKKIQSLEQFLLKIQTNRSTSLLKNANSVNLALKSSQTTTHLTRTQIPLEQKPSKLRFINKYKSLINNRKQREQVFSSDSSEQSEVEETLVQGQENSVQRFLRLVSQAKLRVPIKVQIDQTGYIKSADTGMYLVDSLGDGFELNFEELSDLIERGIIEL